MNSLMVEAKWVTNVKDFVDFWNKIMVNRDDLGVPDSLQGQGLNDDVEFWRLITLEEIHSALPDLEKAPGPDGISARQILNLPRVLLCKILNVFICLRGVRDFYPILVQCLYLKIEF